MASFQVLHIATMVMVFSVGYLLGELLLVRFGKGNDEKFLLYARRFLLLLSVGLMIWLLFQKELFHWHYDMATGEPVDHYSTYGKCIAYTMIALVSNAIAAIIRHARKHTRKK